MMYRRVFYAVAWGLFVVSITWSATTSTRSSSSVLENVPPLRRVTLENLTPPIAGRVRQVLAASPAKRGELCQQLAALGKPGVEGLLVLLGNTDANVRWEAVSVLAETDSPETLPALRAMLRDPNWGVRSEAARGLSWVGVAEDEALLRALAGSDPSQTVRMAALRSVETLRQRLRTGVKPKSAKRISSSSLREAAKNVNPMASASVSIAKMSSAVQEKPFVSSSVPETGQVSLDEPEAPRTAVENLVPMLQTMKTPRPGEGMISPKPSVERFSMPAESVPLDGVPTNATRRPSLPVDDEAVRATAKRVDELIYAKIRELQLEASPQASDAEFLRRVTLDLTGKIPSANVAADFLLVKNASKRERYIQQLLDSPESSEYLARVWTTWLLGNATENQTEAMRFRAWLQTAFAENRPYDEIARQLIAATGPSHQDGAANYLLRYDVSPTELAARTSRFFLGLPMQCAQCHDHKTEPWTQRDFYGVVAFFSPTRQEPLYEDVVENGQRQRRYIGSYLRDGEAMPVTIPEKGISVKPTYLDGSPAQLLPGQNARKVYAEWVTRPDNPYFAKATVNRVWAYFFGRGFVEPLDGFGVKNSPTHPELLDFLARDFVAHGYDLRYLIRVILNTEAYQRSSKTTEKNKHDELYFTHALIRPLTASQLFSSLLEATNVESAEKRRRRDFEAMRREYERQYEYLFGNDEQEAEIVNKATISQALMMLNGTLVNEGSRDVSGTRLDRILQTVTSREKRLDAIYVAVLSRLPTPAERSYFRFYYEGSSYRDKNKCYEDLYWSLLNSAEFATNH